MISDVRENNRMANQSENWVSEGHAVCDEACGKRGDAGRGGGFRGAGRTVVEQGRGTGRYRMLAGGSLGLDRQLRPGFLRHGARCCPPQWALRSEGCCTSYHEGLRKARHGQLLAIAILATGPTECPCKPSNLSELVELVNGVTEIHYGRYNKADHDKSRIRATANLSSCVGAPWSSQTPSPTPRAYPRRRRHTRS
jgi:hypothetical protein